VAELTTQLQALQGQHQSVTEQMKELGTKASKVDELTAQFTAAQAEAQTQTKLNSRLQTLMKFPQLLSNETVELVKSTSLEGEALEKVLAPLAAKLGTGPVLPPGAGSSPTQPPKSNVTPQDLMQEAMAFASQGKWKEYNAKLAEAAQVQDAAHGKNLPPIDRKDTLPSSSPPVG
jgi:hypothetical protein